ncbi:Protein PLANT CADMIUM RESISTANCE 9 [Camellia lanceoleosa]|uniref:Protein PLANT CADMIUM RESISTANCE 9 n=1 Tax=Camellia lanceoleosa TaxID=1840588 RepID=A0ACC0I5W3_9ERIC|nr:Protein PLANT CADMIUM RESISTANCE 9 [Camellia lanceoleosa]
MSQNNTNNPKSSDSYPPHGQWTTGFNDYCDDPSICFKVCCLPCIPMGQVAEIVDKGYTSCFAAGLIFCILNPKCCGKLYAYSYRSKLRALFSLPEAPHSDFLAHCCCCLCAHTQEYRELKNRGIDPSLGQHPSYSHSHNYYYVSRFLYFKISTTSIRNALEIEKQTTL